MDIDDIVWLAEATPAAKVFQLGEGTPKAVGAVLLLPLLLKESEAKIFTHQEVHYTGKFSIQMYWPYHCQVDTAAILHFLKAIWKI